MGLQMGSSKPVGIGIVTDTSPWGIGFELEFAEFLNNRIRVRIRLEAGIGGDGALFMLDDIVKNIPRSECRNLSRVQFQLVFEELQNRRIRVALFVVTLDDVVVGLPGKDLGIAGIRKPHSIRELYRAPQRLIAGYR